MSDDGMGCGLIIVLLTIVGFVLALILIADGGTHEQGKAYNPRSTARSL